MFFATIGVLIAFAGFAFSKSPFNISRYAPVLKITGVAIAILGILSSGIRQIDAGTIGVQSLFGKVNPDILENGLHFVNPLAEVTIFDAKTQNYTMSAQHSEGELQGDDAIRVLSADGLEVVIDLTVLYKIMPDKAPAIYKGIGADLQRQDRKTHYPHPDSRQCGLL